MSAAGAIVTVRLMYNGIISKIAEGIKLFTPLDFSEIAFGVSAICIVFGILSGVAGSLIATSRYIRKD
jgi:translation elongation factor EF-1beta